MRRLVLLAFVWGWPFLFIEVAVEGLTPTTGVAVAAGVGGLLFVVSVTIGDERGLRRPMPAIAGPLALVPVLALLAACGGGGNGRACGRVTREALDPQHLVHVLTSAPEPEYISDPPTSGAHQPGPDVEDVVAAPLPPALQVGVLEEGGVLVQYRPDEPAADREALLELAGDGIVVAPQPDLPAPVVATAWVHKLTCDAVDVTALRSFADARLGKGPDGEAESR